MVLLQSHRTIAFFAEPKNEHKVYYSGAIFVKTFFFIVWSLLRNVNPVFNTYNVYCSALFTFSLLFLLLLLDSYLKSFLKISWTLYFCMKLMQSNVCILIPFTATLREWLVAATWTQFHLWLRYKMVLFFFCSAHIIYLYTYTIYTTSI